jgi:ubiquitin-protein ligase
MTEICKYTFDINNILNTNKWNNDIKLLSCIDNDTYYNLNLLFNNIKIDIITDFNFYCVINSDNNTELNYKLLESTNYNPETILIIIDNINTNKKQKVIDYNDEFNFYQTFIENTKYKLNYSEIKIKSKKFADNKNNIKKISVPKELLFNENQIYTILINEIKQINSNKDYKHYIYPFENNIYDLRAKIFFNNNIELELKFSIDPKFYPFYPPKLEVISPKLKISLLLAIMNLNVLKIENWNYTITFSWLIENIFLVLDPIINNHVDETNKEITELESLLIKLSNITKDTSCDNINIDIKINKTIIKSEDTNSYWKSGTGYGNDKTSKWDIKNFILEKELQEQEIINLLNQIICQINDKHIDTINNSYLLKYIIDSVSGLTLLTLETSKKLFEIIMKILDSLFDYKNKLNETFIKNIVLNLENINSEILFLFQNNEEMKMNNLYQSVYINYNKYSQYSESISQYQDSESKEQSSELISQDQGQDSELKEQSSELISQDQDSESNKIKEYIDIMKKNQFETCEITDNHLFISEKNKKLNSKSLVRVISELSTLKTSLPLNYESTIWLRVPKKDINLFSFMISGPKDTPYENGLFIFHAFFPSDYPNVEPKVLLNTTGMGKVRFNPNLYSSGKVCLSLLGTWSGDQGEKWNKTSTFLQVLVSIQSLIFVDQPYFNEPGYEKDYGTNKGTKKSNEYNEQLQYYTIELAMIDQIINSPPEYKQVIMSHFKIKKNDILLTCKKWVDQAINNKERIKKIYEKLIVTFDELLI